MPKAGFDLGLFPLLQYRCGLHRLRPVLSITSEPPSSENGVSGNEKKNRSAIRPFYDRHFANSSNVLDSE